MADRTPSQNAAEILRMVADVQKELGELSVAMIALNSTLSDLVPTFDARYLAHLQDARSLEVKRQYEGKIGVLLQKADLMSRS